VSTGRLHGLHVSPSRTIPPIEAGKAPLLKWVSLWPAKRLRHSCSTRSSRRNIFTRSWALRNNCWSSAVFTAYLIVTVLAAAANIFSATLDFIRFKQILINMAKVGVSESWITMLGALKAAGALGLL